jgi:predicted glycoside hydrolase/deacetylase ChbG (UPF0249 family)
VIIVNADDWGRTAAETDAAAACYNAGRITSVSAMVFMQDSARAAAQALQLGIDVGLHLNLSQEFSGEGASPQLWESHKRVRGFLTRSKYSLVVYNPALRQEFRSVFQGQLEEFIRLYGRLPSHVDGHHHKHLCSNVLFDSVIPAGDRVRGSFFFWPGEKNFVKRVYRRSVDMLLARRYRIPDFLFSLSESLAGDRLMRIFELAKSNSVELMTHPVKPKEFGYLMSEEYLTSLDKLQRGSYASL